MYNKLRVDYLMLDLINRPDEYIIKVMIAFSVLAYITVEIFVYRKHLFSKSLIPNFKMFLPEVVKTKNNDKKTNN